MIRITITTKPEWTPIAHGSTHGDPSYGVRIQNAKVTTELGQNLPELIDESRRQLDILPSFPKELTRIRYLVASHLDHNSPDIEIEVAVDSLTPLRPEANRSFRDIILRNLELLLDKHAPLHDPHVILCIDSLASFGAQRLSSGLARSWARGEYGPFTQT